MKKYTLISYVCSDTSYALRRGSSFTALAILIIAFIALQFYIKNGGIHEAKTIGAMIFRMLVTLSFAVVAFFYINKQLKET